MGTVYKGEAMSRSSTSNKTRWINRALLVPVLCVPLASPAAGTLNLQGTAPYEKGMPVPDAVRRECGLEAKVVGFVQSAVTPSFDTIVLVNDASKTGAGK